MKSCLAHWLEIAARLQAASGVFIAFDFDGVLCPIALRPELARLSDQNRSLLERLAQHPRMQVAVVSGRSLMDVRRHVGVNSLFYAGNHGAEIALSGLTEQHISLEHYHEVLVRVKTELFELASKFIGTHIEDKGFGIGVHYREVPTNQVFLFQKQFLTWAKNLPQDLCVLTAKMMYEVRPKAEWNKGSAVLRLWKAVAPNSIPICLGDDRTDEEGFIALRGKGITIFVGMTKRSSADYFLESPAEVTLFMERLLAMT